MAGIRGKNTKPELAIRQGLHARGRRYRLHVAALPGKPDLVFARARAALFVHGCFWHGHGCPLFRWPATNPEFWREKIDQNVRRDEENRRLLLDSGWRVCEVWECSLKGRWRAKVEEVLDAVEKWLDSDLKFADLKGGESGLSIRIF